MKKNIVFSFILLHLLCGKAWTQVQFDNEFRLGNYNRTLATSYKEQIVQVSIPFGATGTNITNSFPMYNTYDNHGGDEDTLVTAILYALSIRYRGISFELDKARRPSNIPSELSNAAIRNNKDIVVQVMDWVIVIGLTIHSYSRRTGSWTTYSYQALK